MNALIEPFAAGGDWWLAIMIGLLGVLVGSAVWRQLAGWVLRGDAGRVRQRTVPRPSPERQETSPRLRPAANAPSLRPQIWRPNDESAGQRSWLQRWRARRLRQALETQLPDALDYMARALRAGHGLRSAMGLLGRELPQPLGAEIRRVTDEIQYGRPMEQALRDFAQRSGSEDVGFFVTSVLIQKDTGGNLADLLAALATLIRARVRLQTRIRVISAEGRASGWLLGFMPLIILGLLSLINPGYVSLLWRSELGQMLSIIAITAMGVGGLWIRTIVRLRP